MVLKAPVTREEGPSALQPVHVRKGLAWKGSPPARTMDKADAAYFGTAHDGTDPANGVYYYPITGLPYAINIPISFAYPF